MPLLMYVLRSCNLLKCLQSHGLFLLQVFYIYMVNCFILFQIFIYTFLKKGFKETWTLSWQLGIEYLTDYLFTLSLISSVYDHLLCIKMRYLCDILLCFEKWWVLSWNIGRIDIQDKNVIQQYWLYWKIDIKDIFKLQNYYQVPLNYVIYDFLNKSMLIKDVRFV